MKNIVHSVFSGHGVHAVNIQHFGTLEQALNVAIIYPYFARTSSRQDEKFEPLIIQVRKNKLQSLVCALG